MSIFRLRALQENVHLKYNKKAMWGGGGCYNVRNMVLKWFWNLRYEKSREISKFWEIPGERRRKKERKK